MTDEELRAIEWTGSGIRLVDQTALPARLDEFVVRDVDGLVSAIRRLAVRGAPALGAAGAFGVAVAMQQGAAEGWGEDRLAREIDRIRAARPTATNLAGGVNRVAPLVPYGVQAVAAEAEAIVAEDEAANRALSGHGADWILARHAHPVRALTHCNTGPLATTAWGTALGVLRELHVRGALGQVYADETRPLVQGSRLTAWELARLDIPHLIQVDAAAASTIVRGLVDAAVVGADRVTASGDVANKIGTLPIALACAEAGIPFVVAAPESTVDPATPSGADIAIEGRAEEEVLCHAGQRVAPEGSRAHNPAFDVTPARLVTALATERGVFEVSAGQLPAAARSGAAAAPAEGPENSAAEVVTG